MGLNKNNLLMIQSDLKELIGRITREHEILGRELDISI